MIAYTLDVHKWKYSRKEDWLAINDKIEPYDFIVDDSTEIYSLYFGTFDERSNYIDKITVGHRQFWADSRDGIYGREEILEYHNGSEWDEEIHLDTKVIKIDNSLIDLIKK